MQFLQGLVSPQVYELAERSGAKIISFREYANYEKDLNELLRMTFTAGFYNAIHDLIVIQPQHAAPQGFTVDEVLLHELVHWTGARNRLRRKVMLIGTNPRLAKKILSKPNEIAAFRRVRETEELIAHAGMFELSSALGLNMVYAEYSLNRYARYHSMGNMWQAADKALEAARYLLSLAERRPLGVEEFFQSHVFMK